MFWYQILKIKAKWKVAAFAESFKVTWKPADNYVRAEILVYKLALKTRLLKSKNGPFNSDLAKVVENT